MICSAFHWSLGFSCSGQLDKNLKVVTAICVCIGFLFYCINLFQFEILLNLLHCLQEECQDLKEKIKKRNTQKAHCCKYLCTSFFNTKNFYIFNKWIISNDAFAIISFLLVVVFIVLVAKACLTYWTRIINLK